MTLLTHVRYEMFVFSKPDIGSKVVGRILTNNPNISERVQIGDKREMMSLVWPRLGKLAIISLKGCG